MKKTTFRNISLVTTATLCLGMLSVPAKDASAEKDATIDPTYAIVNDFEKIADLYELEWSNCFGSATLNTDMEYVTSGTASMKLNPVGRFKPTDANPKIMIPLNRHKEHAASKMTSVEFDVFNASGNDATINCALAIDGTNTKYLNFEVKNGEQKTIKLEYDLVAMSGAYNIDNVEGIYVQFPMTLDRENYKENVFYVDKFVAYYTPFESKGYEMSFADGEFCSFDEIYHEYMVNTNCGTGAIEGYRPELSINTDSYYCADKDSENFVYGKNKSLKLVAKGGGTEGNPGFTFSDKIWHNFEWSEMNDKALTFDVYNASESAFSFSLIIFRNPDNYQTGYYDRYSKGFTVPAYSWITVSLSIKEMNETTKGTNGNPMTSYIQYGKVVYTYGLPFFIYNAAAVGNQDRTFYFDNFRITDVEA